MRLSHAEAQALISARLDGPLDAIAERELHRHLASCPTCAAFNTSTTQLTQELQTLAYLPASPAVSRAILDHISRPRSPLLSFTDAFEGKAAPAAAVAAAVIVLFLGSFGLFRYLDDDPNPTPTSETLAQRQDDPTETTVPATDEPTDEPATDEPTDPPADPTETPEPPKATETEVVPTDTPDPAAAQAATEEAAPTETTEPATEEPAPTDPPADPTETTEPPKATETEVVPTETPEPEATEPAEENPATAEDEEAGIIGPTGNSGTAESKEEPESTPEPEPTSTDEPTATATDEPEPTSTDEPTATATDEPVPTNTAEPTETSEPEPTATDTPAIEQRDETPVSGVEEEVTPETDDPEAETPAIDDTGEAETPEGDGTNGDDQTIEPIDGTAIDPENPEETDPGSEDPEGGEVTSLDDAPEYESISDVSGDSSQRLGLSSDGTLIFSQNPGRVSLVNGDYDLSDRQLCGPDGSCAALDAANETGTTGEVWPLGWIGDEAIYLIEGSDGVNEIHAIQVGDDGQPVNDRLLQSGGEELVTLVRPYPYRGGLLVPTNTAWILVTSDGVQQIADNPYGIGLTQYRFNAEGGTISYVADGQVVLASLDSPSTPIVTIPYDGDDYAVSPVGDMMAIKRGNTIDIVDTSGNVIASYTSEEGMEIGSMVWNIDGLVFVDYTSGTLRLLTP